MRFGGAFDDLRGQRARMRRADGPAESAPACCRRGLAAGAEMEIELGEWHAALTRRALDHAGYSVSMVAVDRPRTRLDDLDLVVRVDNLLDRLRLARALRRPSRSVRRRLGRLALRPPLGRPQLRHELVARDPPRRRRVRQRRHRHELRLARADAGVRAAEHGAGRFGRPIERAADARLAERMRAAADLDRPLVQLRADVAPQRALERDERRHAHAEPVLGRVDRAHLVDVGALGGHCRQRVARLSRRVRARPRD